MNADVWVISCRPKFLVVEVAFRLAFWSVFASYLAICLTWPFAYYRKIIKSFGNKNAQTGTFAGHSFFDEKRNSDLKLRKQSIIPALRSKRTSQSQPAGLPLSNTPRLSINGRNSSVPASPSLRAIHSVEAKTKSTNRIGMSSSSITHPHCGKTASVSLEAMRKLSSLHSISSESASFTIPNHNPNPNPNSNQNITTLPPIDTGSVWSSRVPKAGRIGQQGDHMATSYSKTISLETKKSDKKSPSSSTSRIPNSMNTSHSMWTSTSALPPSRPG
ncbi:hypothetical protein AAMO2058_000304500 [Amorphochlora amoebiformis]